MSEFYTPRRNTTRTVPPAPKSKKYYKFDRDDKVVRRLDFTDIPRKRQITHGYVNYRPKRKLFELNEIKDYKSKFDQEIDNIVRDNTLNEIKRDIETIKCDLRKITDILFECYFLEKEDYLEPEIKLKRENAFCKN